MIVTRSLINKNIKFIDTAIFENKSCKTVFFYDSLSALIDNYKNMLEFDFNCKPGQSVLIGEPPGLIQIALIFASLELGLSLIIVDYDRPNNIKSYKFVDPKTQILLPIDFFILGVDTPGEKFDFFKNVSTHTIILKDRSFSNNKNANVYATKETLLMKCTSSGTTGTPKKVEHTHEFIFELIQRNKIFFNGRVGITTNLNHGSSLATYFLPAVISDNVTEFYSLRDVGQKPKRISKYHLDHLMLPYTNIINEFLSQRFKKNPNLTIYTLSTIKKNWKKSIDNSSIKNIVSFFGSNETSGPVFINQLNDIKFEENKFTKFDNFYKTEINDSGLHVSLPVYNTTISTNDKFTEDRGSFYYLGRNDLIRINGCIVDMANYQSFIKNLLDADIVIDTVHNEIYLALWSDDLNKTEKLAYVNDFMVKQSNGAHTINKHAVLFYEDFLSGIKLDQELLRDYFRKYVKEK
jgi:acyl-CoA synthetase (AMP-forming)/AMP-acid ligase II